MEGRNRWYEYNFKEFVFVTYILVSTEDYTDYDKFNFEWLGADGKTYSRESKISDKSTFVWINDIIIYVKFKPPTKWLSSPTINEVILAGIPKSDINKFITVASTIDTYRNTAVKICEKAVENANNKNQEIARLDAQILTLNNDIQKLSSKKTDITKDNVSLNQKSVDLTTNKSSIEDSIKVSNDILAKIDEDISVNTKSRKQLADEISEKSKELKLLTENINIFPTEIVGFANQSSKNISLYWKIIAIPIIIISLMFALLVFSAADLTTVIARKKDVDIWAIFLTRLPYVAIATVIVTACYKICRVFVGEMIKINQQKLGLTKVSIIAKDVASAAENRLNLNDRELFQLRAHLKMELLRDHMKEYLSKDFVLPLPNNITGMLQRIDPLNASGERVAHAKDEDS